MIWALYLLFLAGATAGCGQVVKAALANRRAGRPRPGSHEDLP